MLTLSDYQKMNNDLIVSGMYDWLFKEDAGILKRLAVNTLRANGAKYNVKTSRATVSFQDPMDDIPETQPAFSQRSAALYVAIIDAYLSKFAKATNGVQDADAVMLKSTTDDFIAALYDKMIAGQTSTAGNTKQPKGLLKLIAELESEAATDLDSVNNSQVVAATATTGALTTAKIDETIDACIGCNLLVMNKKTRRKVNALMRASGSITREWVDEFGKYPDTYNGIPIAPCDYIPNNVQDGVASVCDISSYDPSHAFAGAGYDNSFIFALRVKDEAGFAINQAEALGREFVGPSQKKDADIHRFKWYHGFAVYDKLAAAVLINFAPGD
jgi:hypothetical protein